MAEGDIIKSADYKDYSIWVYENGSISVVRDYFNTIGGLRDYAAIKNFAYDDNWNTRQFAKKLCTEFGDGEVAQTDGFTINIMDDGSAQVFREFPNTMAALREIAEKVNFKFEENWNTRQCGNKLIDYINEHVLDL